MQSSSSIGEESSAILLFPRAGGFLRSPARLEAFRRLGKARAISYEPVTSTELADAADDILRRRPSRVVLVGGDGSLMRGISALFRAYRGVPLPTITPVPAGTVNLCASRWGVRGSADRCFAAALAQKPVRVLRVASLHVQLDGASYVAFTLGAGVVSHFFEAYDESPLPGKWAASRIFARTFVGSLYGSSYAKRILAPVPAHVVIDDGDLGSLALSLLVTSVFTNVGLGLKPTYRAGSEPQRLHLVASTLPTRILGPLAWRVLLGLPLRKNAREPEVIDRMVREFSVRFERPRHVVLDGDAIPSTEARVTCGPELDVALPR